MFLEGKKIVIMGVANNKSIAWGCAKAMKDQGATLIYTYQNERMEKQLAKLAEPEDLLIECDVTSDESIRRAFGTIEARVGKIDGLVHAIAYSKKEELGGNVTDISRDGYALAQDISAYSLLAVAKAAKPLLKEFMETIDIDVIGTNFNKGKDAGVDNKELIEVNRIIRNHPVEKVGAVLRQAMTAMKSISTAAKDEKKKVKELELAESN